MPIKAGNLFFDNWDTDRMRSVEISSDTSLKYSPAPTNLQVKYFLNRSDVSIFSTTDGFFLPWKDKVNSVTQYDGWKTLETVQSVNICDRFYELLNVGGLGWIRLILGLTWPQPEKFVFKGQEADGYLTKMASRYKPCSERDVEMLRCGQALKYAFCQAELWCGEHLPCM